MELFIANLNFQITNKQLKEIFTLFGKVTACKIITDRITGESKGYGFVSLTEPSSAERAINTLNGMIIDGRILVVRQSKSPKPQKVSKAKRSQAVAPYDSNISINSSNLMY
jgi:RNA recognition motif-containing protein